MKLFLFVIVCLFVMSEANASGYGGLSIYNNNSYTKHTKVNKTVNHNRTTNYGDKSVEAHGGNAYAKGGKAASYADSQASVGDTKTGDVNVGGDDFDFPVNSAIAAGLIATAECQGSSSGAVQTKVLGISVGGTRSVRDCWAFNEAEKADAKGQPNIAMRLRCTTKVFKLAYGKDIDECLEGLRSDLLLVKQETDVVEHSHPEIDEKLDRAFVKSMEK